MNELLVKKAIRPERNDVFTFFKIKKIVGENDQIIPVEELVEEVTVNQLQDRINEMSATSVEALEKIAAEQMKIEMINNLQDGNQ